MRRLKKNIRSFILFVRLRDMDEPVPVAEAFSIKEVLRLLNEYEEEYQHDIVEKFFAIKD